MVLTCTDLELTCSFISRVYSHKPLLHDAGRLQQHCMLPQQWNLFHGVMDYGGEHLTEDTRSLTINSLPQFSAFPGCHSSPGQPTVQREAGGET